MSKFDRSMRLNRRWFLRGLAFAGGAALFSNLTQFTSLVRAQTEEAASNSADLLKELESIPNPGRPLKVVILGAGMAGLSAAIELEKRGHTCVILEADRSHIGGRVRTLRFEDGLYGDLGAMRIPKTHTLTRHYIDLCGLELRPFVSNNPEAYYYMRSGRVRVKDADKLPQIYSLSGSESELTPDDVWDIVVENRLDKLSEEEKAEIFAEYPQSAAIREMDEQSFLQWCKVSQLSDDALEMMLTARGLSDLIDSSALSIIRLEENLKNDLEEIVGGMDLLPTVLASLLKSKPRMGCEVIGLERDDEAQKATAIYRESGTIKREEGDFVLCTIPFPVLSRLNTPFSGSKQRAIRELFYESSVKVLALANRRFWEADDGIYGGGTYSDLPIATTYYPNDNARAKDPEVSASPGVMLASYSWGSRARRLGDLRPRKRHEVVQQALGLIHPQINENGVLQRMESWNWDNHRWSQGAFTFMKPYQQLGLYKDVIAPEGRIYFAGEHASIQFAWIEGAVESSLRAVREMLLST
ncbi:FAD-dependent oxidoreductase [Scytonema sp. NUACC26]|uniref:flavin monoamine oxidase family protein n=1 Tax=Scytonema sp. NUACC26 TaxID=3140176 RepID=UPI0034DBEFDD